MLTGYKISYAYTSHIGNCRPVNQDNLICLHHYLDCDNHGTGATISGEVTNEAPHVFGVFDGMGGEERGEVAAYIAAEQAVHITSAPRLSMHTLIHYCHRANRAICMYAESNHIPSMGATAAILLFEKKRIHLCNIGDSKVFRFSQDGLEQLSEDHLGLTIFGIKPPLIQNLGIPETELALEPYVVDGFYHHGDKYLICSDGLTDMVSPDEIEAVLKQSCPESATDSLLKKALKNGGRDNITIITLEIKRENRLFSGMFKERKRVARIEV